MIGRRIVKVVKRSVALVLAAALLTAPIVAYAGENVRGDSALETSVPGDTSDAAYTDEAVTGDPSDAGYADETLSGDSAIELSAPGAIADEILSDGEGTDDVSDAVSDNETVDSTEDTSEGRRYIHTEEGVFEIPSENDVQADLEETCDTEEGTYEAPEREIYNGTAYRETNVSTAPDGKIMAAYKGTFYPEDKAKILKRINQFRMEAYDKGWVSSYIPAEWSTSLETTAQIRAAECTVRLGHNRPDGTQCFTAFGEDQKWGSHSENLAWNNSGLMEGIEQWYEEKDDYIKARKGQSHGETGHYLAMIDPSNKYLAVSCFRLDNGTHTWSGYTSNWYGVAGSFSDYRAEEDDGSQHAARGGCYQKIVIPPSMLRSFSMSPSAVHLNKGETKNSPFSMSASTHSGGVRDLGNFDGPAKIVGGVKWKSANPAVVTIDPSTGRMTGIAGGKTKVTGTAGSKAASATVTVAVAIDSIKVYTGDDETTAFSENAISMTKGESIKLNPVFFPADATESKAVVYSTGDRNVATVDSSGWITATGSGETVIKVKLKSRNLYATCRVNVKTCGWDLKAKKYYLYDEDGNLLTGWISEADTQGVSGTGELVYYLEDTTGAALTSWQTLTPLSGNEGTYYFDARGVMQRGWQKIAKKWYYFAKTDAEIEGYSEGQMVHGITTLPDGRSYYFLDDGKLLTGWNPDKTYYADASGVVNIGPIKVGKKIYWQKSDGVIKTEGLAPDGIYYLGADGVATVSKSVEISGKEYYFGSDGMMVKGWQKVGKEWKLFGDDGVCVGDVASLYPGAQGRITDGEGNEICLDGKGGLKKGLVTDETGTYFYGADGCLVRSAWAKSGKKWYLFGSDGKAVSGYTRTNRHRPGLTAADDNLLSDWYYFDPVKHYMVTGWMEDDAGRHYFDKTTGTAASGFTQIGKKIYLFTEESDHGKLITGQDVFGLAWGGRYHLNTDGTVSTGWFKSGDNKYYGSPSAVSRNSAPGLLYTGTKKIGKKWYYFDDNGVFIKEVKPSSGDTPTPADVPKDLIVKEKAGWLYYDLSGSKVLSGKVTISSGNLTGGYFTTDKKGRITKFYRPNGRVADTTVFTYKDRVYGLNAKGMPVTGWFTDKATKKKYYIPAAGYVSSDGIITVKKKKYYQTMDAGIYMRTNTWTAAGDESGALYLVGAGGAFVTGKTAKVGGYSYYLDKDGRRGYGFRKIKGKWYLFDRITGRMVTGIYTDDNGSYCVFSNAGVMTAGFRDGSNNFISGTYETGGKVYFLSAKGVMRTGLIKTASGWVWRRFNTLTGELTV